MQTVTILTTSANATRRMLQKRMSVVPQERDWPGWLGEIDGDMGQLMHPVGGDLPLLWPVSRAINSVRNNGRSYYSIGLTIPPHRRQVTRQRDKVRLKRPPWQVKYDETASTGRRAIQEVRSNR